MLKILKLSNPGRCVSVGFHQGSSDLRKSLNASASSLGISFPLCGVPSFPVQKGGPTGSQPPKAQSDKISAPQAPSYLLSQLHPHLTLLLGSIIEQCSRVMEPNNLGSNPCSSTEYETLAKCLVFLCLGFLICLIGITIA